MTESKEERFFARSGDLRRVLEEHLIPHLEAELSARGKRTSEKAALLSGRSEKERKESAKRRATDEVAGPGHRELRAKVERFDREERIVEGELILWEERAGAALTRFSGDGELRRLRSEGLELRARWERAGERFDRVATQYNRSVKSLKRAGKVKVIEKRASELFKADKELREKEKVRKERSAKLQSDLARLKLMNESLKVKGGKEKVLVEKRPGELVPHMIEDKKKERSTARSHRKNLSVER